MTNAVLLVIFSLVGLSRSCLDPASAYRFTGTVCRLTYPAAAVLNEKTTEVIQAAFQHAKYPSIQGGKSLPLIGKVEYGLHNLEIHNLSIGKSDFELRENDGIGIDISNVSATFKGTVKYGYGSWLLRVGQSVDFEIESQIDLVINSKLYCGKGRVAADTSDCYLTFHKLKLFLQGDREPGWLKRLFTEFITFTVKLVVKGQICKEINTVANILADFIQETAENFLSDGDIGVDISVTSAPVITSSYIESYHKGLAHYHDTKAHINESVFNPAQLTQDRMLYFWISDELMEPLMTAANADGRFVRNISGSELKDLFKTELSNPMPEVVSKLLVSDGTVLRTWSSSVPSLRTTPEGTTVGANAAVELTSTDPDIPSLSFDADVKVIVRASYAEKKLILKAKPVQISILKAFQDAVQLGDTEVTYLTEAVEKIGIPVVISYLEPALTDLMDEQGLNLFDIINPEVLPRDGYVVIQMDFGFPHHLLVEFLKRTLE
ncbi:cholesteryl ester transfer protein [Chanos chanos]|uniref:Cholesteryl ester transfer protein n=1 Tax=Chanos chanos TaxID=29144 RepID=A0A6J2WQK9_CHACN|nr:cholesteryl ester transfer protein [Chanos chanos]